MSILADSQYTLSKFTEISKTSNIIELDSYTIKNINRIAKKVGAPSYIKTPIFKKNRHHKKDKYKSTKDTWEKEETSDSFVKTELNKSVNILEVQFDKIRLFLNKLTNKNYNENLESIIFIMKSVEEENKEYLEKIGKTIFEIGSKNKFWCKLYAQLYKDIIDEFPIMKEICIKNFESFIDIFNTFNFIDSAEDYDLFCEYNKENEKRRSLSHFFVLCANYNILDKQKIIDIVNNLLEKMNEMIYDENALQQLEETMENLKVIIMNFNDDFKNLDEFIVIKSEILKLSKLNPKDYKSLTNKIIFNLMDIIDIM
jgi:hypothetical protein